MPNSALSEVADSIRHLNLSHNRQKDVYIDKMIKLNLLKYQYYLYFGFQYTIDSFNIMYTLGF